MKQDTSLPSIVRWVFLCALGILVFLLGHDRLVSLFQGSDLKIMASHDLANVAPLAALIRQHTGVHVTFVFDDSLERIEGLLSERHDIDAAWFPDTHEIFFNPSAALQVKHQASIMTSPLAVGVSFSVAKSLGWIDPTRSANLGWSAITEAASTGQLAFAMNDPSTLGQGWMALSGVAAAAAIAQGRHAQSMPIDRLALADFLTGYCLAGKNSYETGSQFIKQQGQQVNGWISEESHLLMLNQKGPLKEPLVLIYPREGPSTVDYPLVLLNEAKRDNYQKVLDFLQGPMVQYWLARHTLRRPIHGEVAAKMLSQFPPLPTAPESTFNPDRAFSEAILDIYLHEFRPPQTLALLLDTSTSMQGVKYEKLFTSLQDWVSQAPPLTRRISHLSPRDRLWVLPFAERKGEARWFQMPPSNSDALPFTQPQQSLSEFKDYLTGLQPQNGNTGSALTESMLAALNLMQSEQSQKPLYHYSMVILTDGSGLSSDRLAHFEQAYAQRPPAHRQIPVFWILFGDASQTNIHALIEITGGKVFDVRNTPISKAFREIRSGIPGLIQKN